MSRRNKNKINKAIQVALKIIGTSFLFVGMTLALGLKNNIHIEIYSYIFLFFGALLFIIHSYRANDHMLLLLCVTGFTLVGNVFLDTETAMMIADSYGIALVEEEGFFAKYGSLIVSILKELV